MKLLPRALVLVLAVAAAPAAAQVKVGGAEFLPKNVIFPSSDERSRAFAEGSLSGGCRWVLRSDTRVGQSNDAKDCIVYYYRTGVTLAKRCGEAAVTPEAAPPTAVSTTERTMMAGRSCPNAPFTAAVEAKILSVGTNADGRRQEIVVQPDGTRLIIITEAAAVTVTVVYPDGTADTLTYK